MNTTFAIIAGIVLAIALLLILKFSIDRKRLISAHDKRCLRLQACYTLHSEQVAQRQNGFRTYDLQQHDLSGLLKKQQLPRC